MRTLRVSKRRRSTKERLARLIGGDFFSIMTTAEGYVIGHYRNTNEGVAHSIAGNVKIFHTATQIFVSLRPVLLNIDDFYILSLAARKAPGGTGIQTARNRPQIKLVGFPVGVSTASICYMNSAARGASGMTTLGAK
jgi:hypothetical protein